MTTASLPTVLLADPDSAELHVLIRQAHAQLPLRTRDEVDAQGDCDVWV